jgi:NADH-quinone oxidoreductase subunit K|tara:strand:- start:1516 stop:1827 length:312 start_codon:yes stop_codon:yes gene_type:complete
MMDSLSTYLIISAILFSLGIYGVMTRRNAVAILMGIELILNSANLNFVAFNRFSGMERLEGQVFSIFVIVLAAAEAAIALAIIINLYKNLNTVDVDEADILKG